jgi:hypothetical protein
LREIRILDSKRQVIIESENAPVRCEGSSAKGGQLTEPGTGGRGLAMAEIVKIYKLPRVRRGAIRDKARHDCCIRGKRAPATMNNRAKSSSKDSTRMESVPREENFIGGWRMDCAPRVFQDRHPAEKAITNSRQSLHQNGAIAAATTACDVGGGQCPNKKLEEGKLGLTADCEIEDLHRNDRNVSIQCHLPHKISARTRAVTAPFWQNVRLTTTIRPVPQPHKYRPIRDDIHQSPDSSHLQIIHPILRSFIVITVVRDYSCITGRRILRIIGLLTDRIPDRSALRIVELIILV